MTRKQAELIVLFANHNMNVTDTAKVLYYHRNTLIYHLDKIMRDTGLNPRRFMDLVELLRMAQEVIEHGD